VTFLDQEVIAHR